VSAAGGLDPADETFAYWAALYAISHPAPRTWTAERRDGQGTVSVNSASALLDAMCTDYLKCPVRLPVHRDGSGTRSGREAGFTGH